jgi:hypothetical protein
MHYFVPTLSGTVLVLTGCFGIGARLSPAVSGCYRVEPHEWSSRHAGITGFRRLPEVIALDTARFGRILVPNSWRLNDPPNINRASLALYLPPWRWHGDTLQFDPLSTPHPVANDSVIVAFSGWGGTVTAFLERQSDGFSGIGIFSPQVDPARVPGVRIRLRPGTCPSDLSEAFGDRP